MNATLQITVKDVDMLKNWKIADDAAKRAINEYRTQEERQNIMGYVARIAPLIIAVLTALYAYLQVRK